ncbi:uncharacterized protein LOC114970464 [Acropora millepora]|uniref:uncharacterized protein LOC114970464 n=1 Tax=Acropora millepora TaxID=45264 RepID=UPI001CF4553B|nr:uncharacterized protein LOC114970464 [Acropora millepora]
MLNSKGSVTSILLSVICFYGAIASHSETVLFVSASHGNDTSPNCTKANPCKTFDRVLNLASAFISTTIFAAKGNYSMNASHHFERMSSFRLSGNASSREDVQITCTGNVSISFILSENITVEGIKFVKCGDWHPSSVESTKNNASFEGARFKTAFDFRYCRGLRISEVEISESPGLGANLYDVGGVVEFSNVLFADNHARNVNDDAGISLADNTTYVHSGGGVNLKLNRYGYDTANVTPSQHDSYQHNNSYVFTSCHFLRNEAFSRNATKKIDLDVPRSVLYDGGGLAVYFTGNASGCIVKIETCYFYRNRAMWCGGLQVEILDNSHENSLQLQNTTFEKNYAFLGGGGAELVHVPDKFKYLRLNQFKVMNCTFIDNTATWGGGILLYGRTILRKFHKHILFRFINCRWLRNVGTIGAAVEIILRNDNANLIGPEVPFHVCFENDTLFHGNRVAKTEVYPTIGEGSVYSVEASLIFRGNALFTNNSQSALVLDGATIELHDKLDFINNSGLRGGAMAMYGRSRVIFNKNSILNFEKNKCDYKGGALYIQAPGSPLARVNSLIVNVHPCFFGYVNPKTDYDDWDTTVIFKYNTAPKGKSIYATTLNDCGKIDKKKQHKNILKWKFVKFNDGRIRSNEVTTDTMKISACLEDWNVAPGEVFDARVNLIDEVNNSVAGIVKVTVNGNSVNLNTCNLFLATDKMISNITLSGNESAKFSVQLDSVGNVLLSKRIDNVVLKKCYPGFEHSNKTLRCECLNKTSKAGRGVSHCGPKKKTVFIKKGFWAGRLNETFFTYFCPIGYCNSNLSEQYYEYLKDQMCQNGRNQSSTLCGKCYDDYSISFGSEACFANCKYWNLFYLILIGAVLIVLVILIMLINVDFFTGYLNAWLYSYQVMNLLTPDEFQFDPVIQFIIALSKFRLYLYHNAFCLPEGLDDADKLMITYALPLFVILTVWLLSQLVKRYPQWCLSKRVRAPHRAICTIFVLCYASFTTISLEILQPATLGSQTVLFQNGSIKFFEDKHRVYGIIAILIIVIFVLPFPLILLFRPFLTKGLRPILNLHRWGPYFDAFQGCLKDRYRWCAAFYFICRLGILLVYTYLPDGVAKPLVLQCACILILVVFSSLRPYKEAHDVGPGERSYEWINISDVAVLTTLSLISVLSAPTDSSSQASDDAKNLLGYIVNVLAYGPLVVLVALAYRVFRNRYPEVTLNCCAPQEDRDDLLNAMSETSVTLSSSIETPSMCDGRGSRDSSRGSIRRNRRSQQNSKGSKQSNSGSQEVYRGGNPV